MPKDCQNEARLLISQVPKSGRDLFGLNMAWTEHLVSVLGSHCMACCELLRSDHRAAVHEQFTSGKMT